MRLRLVSVIAAIVVAVWLVCSLWPQQSLRHQEVPSTVRGSASEQSHTEPEPVPFSRPAAEPARRESDTFVRGIITDTGGAPLEGTDILHRVLPIAADQQCYELPDIELELDSNTALVTSDARGQFSVPLQAVPRQSIAAPDSIRHCLLVSAHKQGYLATTVSLPLQMDQLPGLIGIELSPNRSVSGRVVDPTGRTVGGATVITWPTQMAAGADRNCVSEQPDPEAKVSTHGAGEFTLHVAGDAGYCLQAFHPDWSRSQPHRITPEERMNLQLKLGYRVQLGGTVIDLQGGPLANFALALVEQGPDGSRELTRTDDRGQFVFDHLDQIRYRLTSLNTDYRIAEPQEIDLADAQSKPEITVKVFPVTLIRGTVLDTYGKGLSRVEVSAYSPYNRSATLARTTSDGQGDFSLPSLHRSNVAYETFQMATEMLDASAANQPFTGELCLDFFHSRYGSHALSLAVNESTLDLGSIQLREPAIQIGGRVLNHRDQPVAATLVLTADGRADSGVEARMPRCEDFTLTRRISTDADGRFSFGLSSPGPYLVEVTTDRYKARTFHLEFTASDSNVEIKLH